MMSLYELTKKYGEGNGEDMMWKTIRIVSDAVESGMDNEHRSALMRKVYGVMSDKHYNEESSRDDVARMYYVDADGEMHDAPYWPEEAVKAIYDSIRTRIPDYNFWDFFTTMNMVASDNWCMLKRWFPRADSSEMNEKITEMSLNWLNDDDWPTKTKIWDYLSGR